MKQVFQLRTLVLAGLQLGAVACGEGPGETPSTAAPPQLAFVDSCRLAPSTLPGSLRPYAAPGDTVLYLNFEGATIVQAEASSAWEQESFLCGATIPAFDHRPFGENRAAVLEQVTQRVARLFAPFPLTVVTERPLWPPFDMALIGGDAALCGLPSGQAGYGPLDCDNARAGEIAFIFSQTITNLDLLALVIAHELGHAYGLLHTLEPCDVMSNFYCPLADKAFLDQPLTLAPDHQGSCGKLEQNSYQDLLAALGGTPPLLDAAAPAADAGFIFDAALLDNSAPAPVDGASPLAEAGDAAPGPAGGCQFFPVDLPWPAAFLVPLFLLLAGRRGRWSASGGETTHGHFR